MDISIRFAEETDIASLKRIWSICFGDTDAYITSFLNHCFCPENTVVACVEENVVGVIYLLPATVKNQKFMYGYAIGVLPRYRGNNICEKMHEFVKTYAEEEKFIYGLHPANEKLFSYYRRTGLQDMYSLRMFDASDLASDEAFLLEDTDSTSYFPVRQKTFTPYVEWGGEMLSYIFKEIGENEGFTRKIWVSNKERYIIGKVYDNTVFIKETTMTDDEILRVSGFLKETFSAKRLLYILPNTSKLGEKTATILGFGKKNDQIYMNLFLD